MKKNPHLTHISTCKNCELLFVLLQSYDYYLLIGFYCFPLLELGQSSLPLKAHLYPRIILIINLRIITLILNFSPKLNLLHYITSHHFGYHQCCLFSYFMTPAWNTTMVIDTMLKKRESNYILGFFWTWVTKPTFE